MSDALLRALMEGDAEDQPEKAPCHEAQVMELRRAYARYHGPCPFEPGDLVTPMASSIMKNAGDPHIVLEVRDEPFFIGTETLSEPSDWGSASFGAKLDVRVACYSADRIAFFWTESHALERWEG